MDPVQRQLFSLLCVLILTACQSGPGNAPVSDRKITASERSDPSRASLPPKSSESTRVGAVAAKSSGEASRKRPEADWRPGEYTVKRGDTLYAIALDHGLDYRELAAWNGLADPNRILAGQNLRLRAPVSAVVPVQPAPVATPDPAPIAVESKPLEERAAPGGDALPPEVALKAEPKAEKVPYSDEAYARIFGRPAPVASGQSAPSPAPSAVPVPAPTPMAAAPAPAMADREGTFDPARWLWPAKGDLLTGFDGGRNKGITIGGKPGDAVMAANSGKVVYVGNAIQAYGHLAIIKHGAEYLTVYAHNALIVVKEGQQVAAGQKIAEMGARPGAASALHFEVRKLGRPIDPVKVLPAR